MVDSTHAARRSGRRRLRRAISVAALLLAAGCGGSDRPAGNAGAARVASGAAAEAPESAEHAGANDWFVDQAQQAGINFSTSTACPGEYYFPEMLPPGVALFDYDNDGDLDVFLAQGQMLGDRQDAGAGARSRRPGRSRCAPAVPQRSEVRPDGTRQLHFTDVTEASGIDARGYGMGVAAGDFDNDGCVDLYLTYFGPNQLWRNNCDGTFTDVSRKSGTDDAGWSVSASFVDYDRDGWLDLYVGNYVHTRIKPNIEVHRPDRQARLLHAERLLGAADPPLSQQPATAPSPTSRRAALTAGDFGPALGVVDRRLQRRRLAGHLRGERRQGKPALDEPAQRHLQEHRRCCRARR